MDIDPRTREYLMWTVKSVPVSATFEVSFNDGATWHPLEFDTNTLKVLVQGPDSTIPAGSAILLPRGRSEVLVRANTSSQSLVRVAGVVEVD